MKKVLLALFLMSGIVSTGFSALDFSITDERGVTQSGILRILELKKVNFMDKM